MSKNTIMFEGFKDSQLDKKEALVEIYTALTDRGYNAVDQIVGYLTSGDPSYITSHNNARNLILKIDRDELLEEIRDVTSRSKFAKYFPKEDVESLIEFMQLIGEVFEPKQQVTLCRDEADDYLLALAIEAKANYLVTGDQDLLVLQEIDTCRIVDAASFERII